MEKFGGKVDEFTLFKHLAKESLINEYEISQKVINCAY